MKNIFILFYMWYTFFFSHLCNKFENEPANVHNSQYSSLICAQITAEFYFKYIYIYSYVNKLYTRLEVHTPQRP